VTQPAQYYIAGPTPLLIGSPGVDGTAYAENASLTSAMGTLSVSPTDVVTVGDAIVSSGVDLQARAGGSVRMALGGVVYATVNAVAMTVTAPLVAALGIGGNPAAASPAAAAFTFASSAIAAAGANLVLTIAQSATPVLVISGSLTASITVTLPSVRAPFWVDATAATLGGHTITFQYATTTKTYAMTTNVCAHLFGDGSAHLYGFLGS